MKTYKPRIADKELQRKLAGIGAVLIEGPKWCGKTTTAEQQASTIIYMDDPLYKEQNLRMADINPKVLLVGESPYWWMNGNSLPNCGIQSVLKLTIEKATVFYLDGIRCSRKDRRNPSFRSRPVCMADNATHEFIRVWRIFWRSEFGGHV